MKLFGNHDALLSDFNVNNSDAHATPER